MTLLDPANGSFAHRVGEWAKYVAYRTPVLREVTRPRYPYGLEPAQLAWLVRAIDDTRGSDGAIVEVGVARGMTSAFLLEHLRLSGDARPFYCIDTFSGFTEDHVAYEVEHRGKAREFYSAFGYNDRGIFERNLRLAGYPDVHAVEADASSFNWSSIPPIDVMLLDIDLYVPTIAVLRDSYSRWSTSARILLDDVRPGTEWDGAHAAYYDFSREQALPPVLVGTKGGAFVKGPGAGRDEGQA